jgi:uncharacterized membrane protein required for colicin V production
MAITDIVFLIILLILISNGASKGFLRSAISPFAFAIAAAIAWFWYTTTRQTLAAILIVAIGPLVVKWLIGFAFLSTPTPARLTPASRASGALINAVWGAAIFIMLLAIPVLFPLKDYGAGMISDDIMASYTFRAFEGPLTALKLIAPRIDQDNAPVTTTEEDITSLMNDERIQQLMTDPDIQKAAQERNIGALLSNPAVMDLAKDPALITKMLRLYPEMQKRTAEMGSPAE